MKTMVYLCNAERQVRMKAVAIRPERHCNNECPFEGHPLLPNDKPGIMPFHLVGICVMLFSTEKNRRNLFQYGSNEPSIILANNSKKRLLNSGKDNTKTFLIKRLDVLLKTLRRLEQNIKAFYFFALAYQLSRKGMKEQIKIMKEKHF